MSDGRLTNAYVLRICEDLCFKKWIDRHLAAGPAFRSQIRADKPLRPGTVSSCTCCAFGLHQPISFGDPLHPDAVNGPGEAGTIRQFYDHADDEVAAIAVEGFSIALPFPAKLHRSCTVAHLIASYCVGVTQQACRDMTTDVSVISNFSPLIGSVITVPIGTL